MTAFGKVISGLLLLPVALLATPVVAAAQSNFPSRPIKIIVPFGPASGPDVVARLLAEKLAAKTGQTVIVENRPGGAANIAAQAVANAEPDGNTLLITPPGPLVTHQHLFARLGFDPRQFAPVSVLVKFPFVLGVRASLPVSNLQQLVAHAKENPGKLNFGSAGRGGPPHLMAEMLQMRAGIRLVYVPYRGLVEAQADLAGGQIDMLFHDLGNTLPHISSGKVKALGVTSEARIPELPDVPAIAESYPGFLAISWFALVAPPKTPQAVSESLSQVAAETFRMPDVVQRLRNFSMTPAGMSPTETAAFLKEEAERWREVIVAAGIKPE